MSSRDSRGIVETPEFAKMFERLTIAYGKRVGDADEVDLAHMLNMRDRFDHTITYAVYRQRAKWGRSWSYIAQAAGYRSAQAAQQRWGKACDRILREKVAELNDLWNTDLSEALYRAEEELPHEEFVKFVQAHNEEVADDNYQHEPDRCTGDANCTCSDGWISASTAVANVNGAKSNRPPEQTLQEMVADYVYPRKP